MRTAESAPGTVLHRLIQEQLRFGNLADTRALLAIQQQALHGSAGPRSPPDTTDRNDGQRPHVSTRQDPQGQEHRGNCAPPEKPSRISFNGEELPTYEEARVHSRYLKEDSKRDLDSDRDAKREHARSLSERLMRLTLERGAPPTTRAPAMSPSLSFPQLYYAALSPGEPRGPPPGYPPLEKRVYFPEPTGPPPFYPRSRSDEVGEGDALRRENQRLRREVDLYAEKAARLSKLEKEVARISEAYETLLNGSAKREALEKTMRNKLEAQMKRMHDFNRDLREQVCTTAKQQADKEAERSEHKQHVFLKLLEQNEEQQRERDRLETSIQNLRVSAGESQRGRELLEKALLSAHTRNRQLEDELQRKRAYVEKVERLQSSLGQLQAACEKREELEMRLRTRLEQELKSMRAQQNQTAGPTASEPSSSSLSQQQLREMEERILALEADITKWEQKYLEESTMRHFAMDAAATAAAQRDTTIIKNSPGHSPDSSFNEELPLGNYRHQEMENRIRALHAQLLEKDAMIKVLQQRSRWEQSNLEKQGLRSTRSVPSIATATGSAQTKRKSFSDDRTGGAAQQRRGARRDSATQCEQPPVNLAKDDSATWEKDELRPLQTSLESEMVEILI